LVNEISLYYDARSKKNIKFSHIYTGPHVKYPLFFSDFNATRIISTDIGKILK